MSTLITLSDAELVARLPSLVQAERGATLEVIEHLVEMERRRLYLAYATSSLFRYCIERLGYAEDAALKRHRVARLALRVPEVLEALRAGTIHLTGLFLLSAHLNEENAGPLLSEARDKSKRQIEEIIARWFPRPDVTATIERAGASADQLAGGQTSLRISEAEQPALLDLDHRPVLAGSRPFTCSGAGASGSRARLEPLSPSRWRVEFSAGAELREKLERARELLSHAVPSGDLGELFERALDALLEKETRKRFGLGQARKARKLKERSRHVPVEIERAVWERDAAQCTFVDAEGRRCGERRFLTIEHQQPFALGGRSELDNLCLFCSAHNQASAREVFGPRHIGAKISARRQSTPEAGAARAEASGARADAPARRAESAQESGEQQPAGPHANSRQTSRDAGADVRVALCNMGFRRREAAAAVSRVCTGEPDLEIRELLKKSLWLLVPAH